MKVLSVVCFAVVLALSSFALAPAPAAAEGGQLFSIEPTGGFDIVDVGAESSVTIKVTIKNQQNVPDTADVYCFYSYLDDQRTFMAQTDRLGAGGEEDVSFVIDLRARMDAGSLLPVNLTVKRANDEAVQDSLIIIIRSIGYYGFEIVEPASAAGQFDEGGFMSLPVTIRNTGNMNYAARLVLLVDGEVASYATGQVSPGGETVIDMSWDDPTEGEHLFTLRVHALLGYNNGDMDDPILSEVLDTYEFTYRIPEKEGNFNRVWVISGIVAVLLIVVIVVAIKIKRNNG